jgi:hypothetical protein
VRKLQAGHARHPARQRGHQQVGLRARDVGEVVVRVGVELHYGRGRVAAQVAGGSAQPVLHAPQRVEVRVELRVFFRADAALEHGELCAQGVEHALLAQQPRAELLGRGVGGTEQTRVHIDGILIGVHEGVARRVQHARLHAAAPGIGADAELERRKRRVGGQAAGDQLVDGLALARRVSAAAGQHRLHPAFVVADALEVDAIQDQQPRFPARERFQDRSRREAEARSAALRAPVAVYRTVGGKEDQQAPHGTARLCARHRNAQCAPAVQQRR